MNSNRSVHTTSDTPCRRLLKMTYTRVSTSSQDAQLQLDALVSAGVQKRDVFADVTSGSKTAIERPGMKRLLEYAEEGDTVVVWRVDRLGRSLIDVLNTVNLLRQRGVQVRSISDGIDPATSTGQLMLNMLATLAEYERELIVERVNAGWVAVCATGQHGLLTRMPGGASRRQDRLGHHQRSASPPPGRMERALARPLTDPIVVGDKLAIAQDARAKGRTPKMQPASSAGVVPLSTATRKPSPHESTTT
jgi:predicted site-specific integrase-resolvase